MRRYVASHLLGGLGNQLFQYAAGRALALKLGADLVLDATAFRVGYCQRPLSLSRFPVKGVIAQWGSAKPPRGASVRLPADRGGLAYARAKAKRIIAGGRAADPAGPWLRVFRHDGFDYDRRFAALSEPAYLAGYWQSYRYFEDHADRIAEELTLPTPSSAVNREWLSRIRAAQAVCVHVRRGDYTQMAQQRTHGLCSLAYYEAAMRQMAEEAPGAQFFIFSDDLAWCRTNLRGDRLYFVDANGADRPEDDLALMMACRHHVIANSSLSWWGAWLARGAGRIVIAPDPWFVDGTRTPDLLPRGWRSLPRA